MRFPLAHDLPLSKYWPLVPDQLSHTICFELYWKFVSVLREFCPGNPSALGQGWAAVYVSTLQFGFC